MADQELKQDIETAEERIHSGVAQVQADGTLSRFDTPTQTRKILHDLRAQDPAAHDRGLVRHRVLTINLGGG